MLHGEALDLHDKADLGSKAALDFLIVEHDVEEAVEIANESFDLAIRAVACGIGLPAESCTTDEVLELMVETWPEHEAYYIIHDEYTDLSPGDFQEGWASFSDVRQVEEYVRLAREVVIHLLDRGHRPRWESLVRESWPQVVALLRAVSPDTCERIHEDPQEVSVTGTRILLHYTGSPEHGEVVTEAVRREIPELPREIKVRFTVRIGGRVYKRISIRRPGDIRPS